MAPGTGARPVPACPGGPRGWRRKRGRWEDEQYFKLGRANCGCVAAQQLQILVLGQSQTFVLRQSQIFPLGQISREQPQSTKPSPFPSPAQEPHTEEEHGPAGSTWCRWDVDTLGDCVINSACAEFGWLRPSRPQWQLCNSDPFRRARPERARGCTSSWETRWAAASALLVPGAGLCLSGQEEVLGCPWEGAEQEGGQGLTCSAAPTPCAPGSPGSARS